MYSAMAWNPFCKVSVYAILAFLLCPAYSTVVKAQDTGTTGIAESIPNRISPRLGVDFNTPRKGDDERSFGRLTGFIPLWQSPGNGLTFLDTAVRLNSTGELGGTVTIGHRFLQGNRVIGGHLSYDIRDTGNNIFNQLGLGIEAFGDTWDIHLNGYLPVGNTQQSAGSIGNATSQVTNTQFQGNQLVFVTTGSSSEFLESAWGGVDLDAGIQLADWADGSELWGYGGVYYHGDTVGGRLRLDHRVEDWMRLGLGVQSDDTFGTRGFFSIGFSWGDSTRKRSDDGINALWARAAETVTRNSSIVIKESEVITSTPGTEVAINPATGQAYTFQHVIPNSGSTTGDGSIENPAANVALVNAQSGDIVYVRAGDSRTNPLGVFTVPAGVVVISDAIAETITTQAGNITLPGSGTGILPLVNATGSNAGITLNGGNNRLSGFEITGAIDANIFVNGSDNALIENNVSRDDLDDGIEVFNSSNVTLTNNTFSNSGDDAIDLENSANAVITNNIISGSSDDGINILTSASPTITSNTINDSGDDAIDITNSASPTITGNTVSNSSDNGIILSSTDNGSIQNNTISNSSESGISIDMSDNVLLQTNQITNSTLAAINLTSANSTTVTGNTISNSGNGAILASNSNTITIQNNRVTTTTTDASTNNVVGAIFLQDVIGTVNISGNTVTETTGTNQLDGQGIILTNSTGHVVLVIDNNMISNNQGDSISVALVDALTPTAGNGTADITITNNIVENNGFDANGVALNPIRGDGIKIAVEENGTINNLFIEGNTLTNNADDGIDISAGLAQFTLSALMISEPNISSSNAQVLNAIVRNNQVTNNLNGPGIILRSLGDDSNIVISVESNILTGNNTTGLNAISTNTSLVSASDLCLALTNNNSDNGFTLTAAPLSIFTAVNRDNLNATNTGTVTFNPAAIGTVNSLADCP